MAGLGHGSAHPVEQEAQHIIERNARVGLVLFLLYLAFYAAYVVINAYFPEVMQREALAGVNLATVYGFALIFAALLLAAIYLWLCREVKPESAEARR